MKFILIFSFEFEMNRRRTESIGRKEGGGGIKLLISKTSIAQCDQKQHRAKGSLKKCASAIEKSIETLLTHPFIEQE